MPNTERKLTYIPIKIWSKLDVLSKELNLTKVQILDEALNLLREKIYDKNPNTKKFKDYLTESSKIIGLHTSSLEKIYKKIELLEAALEELTKICNK